MTMIHTGSGKVTYKAVRKAMNGEAFTMSLTDTNEITCRHFGCQSRHRRPPRSLLLP